MIWMGFDKVCDIPVFRSLRDDWKKRRHYRDVDERQDVLALEPLSSNDFVEEELRVQRERSL